MNPELEIYGLWMFGAFLIAFLIIGCIGANARENHKANDLRFMIRISKMGRK